MIFHIIFIALLFWKVRAANVDIKVPREKKIVFCPCFLYFSMTWESDIICIIWESRIFKMQLFFCFFLFPSLASSTP